MVAMTKRKSDFGDASNSKKSRSSSGDCIVRRALLEQSYAQVNTLRAHVISQLPASSKIRRRKVANFGKHESCSDDEAQLCQLLDRALVCTSAAPRVHESVRWEQWQSFSQQPDGSCATLERSSSSQKASQSDIVDFVIWQLFSNSKQSGSRPKHLLCDGFRRLAGDDSRACTTIPGVYSLHLNSGNKIVRERPWPQLLSVLGQSGDKIMIHLLADCSIFLPAEAGFNNFYQLSGIPFSELDAGIDPALAQTSSSAPRKPTVITLVRSRIFYAKPALNAHGVIRFGFKHLHILNRYAYTGTAAPSSTKHVLGNNLSIEQEDAYKTHKVMMYMFPRQFGLHNVFTSNVDASKTAQRFQDYTMREDEIACLLQKTAISGRGLPKMPKRLRGAATLLVERMRIRHGRCSYAELLRHYCPAGLDGEVKQQLYQKSTAKNTTHIVRESNPDHFTTMPPTHSSITLRRNEDPAPQDANIVEMATPASRVSAFCQAVLSKLIPNGFWGDEDAGTYNKAVFLRKVDHFIKLRRFETMSLFEISQNFKINTIVWLQGPHHQGQRACQSDTAKRTELFHEFLYFVFDSLLIPLIRNNFYVTESSAHRYQIFYFRHDVWKRIAEPAMGRLKYSMLEEVKLDDVRRILGSRKLGFSQIRLLPKGSKLRPITNLRRRQLGTGSSKVLGPSINAVLGPVHSMLKFEKDMHPAELGSAMFSVSEIYDRIKQFKQRLGSGAGPLFFAKVDVQAAFDTIPQNAVVELLRNVPTHTSYLTTKHVEVKPGERPLLPDSKHFAKPIRRWHSTATAGEEKMFDFADQLVNRLAVRKRNTLFINSSVQHRHSATALLHLLAQHVQQNLVKIGKRYYRQKVGIPQGSVLSSFLCNHFYADLERTSLEFLLAPDCLLLRLIDDFLLITLDKSKAVRFLETMHRGIPSHGVVVNHSKTLANFGIHVNGHAVQQITGQQNFPYCGTLINCRTLEISKDRSKDVGAHVFNSLTVDFGRLPGQNFQRKVLNAFKIQSHLMFFDTSHNSTKRVLKSLSEAFIETATKMWAYLRCLPATKQPSSNLVIRTIMKLVDLAFLLLTGKSRKARYPNYKCKIRKSQVVSIAYNAFSQVIHQRQAKYTDVLSWLRTGKA